MRRMQKQLPLAACTSLQGVIPAQSDQTLHPVVWQVETAGSLAKDVKRPPLGTSPCSATNWMACTRRLASSTLRPTLSPFMVICSTIPSGLMMNSPRRSTPRFSLSTP